MEYAARFMQRFDGSLHTESEFNVDLMPSFAERCILQKLDVTRLLSGEERPLPPPLPLPPAAVTRQLLNDEKRHQGQNYRIEAIVPVSIAFAGAAAAPAAYADAANERGRYSQSVLIANGKI